MFLHHEALHRGQTPSRALCFNSRSVRCALSLPTLFLLLALFQISARAQSEAVADDVIRVRTDLVVSSVFVTDARGRRIVGLTPADFAVRDDGRPVSVEYFAAGTERVALLFALDVSGSTRDVAAHQREAALALFSRFGSSSHVGVIRFADRPDLTLPFTTEGEQTQAAFLLPTISNRRTAIFDAAAAAVRAFNARASSQTERRIVILISDGLDTASTNNAQSVIREANANAVSFYVIHLPLYAPRDGRLAARPASKGFRELAEQTGGRYFLVGDAKTSLDPHAQYDLAPVFKAIEEDLNGQYVLGYYPGEAARDGHFHRIEINLSSRNRKLRVRALREGYILKTEESEVGRQKPE